VSCFTVTVQLDFRDRFETGEREEKRNERKGTAETGKTLTKINFWLWP